MLSAEDRSKFEVSVQRFLEWFDCYGTQSYDQFDFWGSRLGVFSKKFYLKNKWLSAPLVVFLQVLESFFPGSRVFFAKKQRFSIGDAHFALGYMNLYRSTGEEKYLVSAKEFVNELIRQSSLTSSGMGWGYPYTWVTGRAVYPPGTPFITVTPYCYHALTGMADLVNDDSLLEHAARVARYAAYDLNETAISEDEVAAGYGPGDNSMVINANTYRAALLLDAFNRFGDNEYKEKAIKNINFVLNRQHEDGSWPYAVNEAFVDNFHSCFVLKNLYKSYRILRDSRILTAVQKGYEYYRRDLVREDGTLMHFSKQTTPKFRKIEMYDYAEGISLGTLLNQDIEGALDFSLHLAHHLIDAFQLKKGYFVTRVTTLNTWNRVPYLRWPQAQLFYALTQLLAGHK